MKNIHLSLLGLLLGAVFSFVAYPATANAASSLQIKPLLVKSTLKPGEVKKGIIDVANPSGRQMTVVTKVQGFKQIDSRGNLQFFDSKELSAGITPDLNEFVLKPHETIRMFYSVDGKKLPSGDVFAAIFFTEKAQDMSKVKFSASATRAQVGTLLGIVNGTPGPRQADIVRLSVPPVSLGSGVGGEVRIKNTADPTKSTGFFPTLTARLEPFGPKVTQQGNLLFAGISRDMKVFIPGNRIGFYKMTVSTDTDSASRIIFMATGWWRWVLMVIVVGLLAAAALVVRRLKQRNRVTFK